MEAVKCDCLPYECCRICTSVEEYERIIQLREKILNPEKGTAITKVPFPNHEDSIGE